MADRNDSDKEPIATPNFIGMLLQCQQDALTAISESEKPADLLRIEFLGAKSELSKLTKQIRLVTAADRGQVGDRKSVV